MTRTAEILVGTILAVVSVVVGAVVALAVVLPLVAPTSLREAAVEGLSAALGRDLSVKGGLELDVSLAPSVVATEITLANAPWGSRPSMLSAERMELELRLLPLILGGALDIERLEIEGADLLIERNAEGRLNVPGSEAADGSSRDGGLALRDLGRAGVSDSRIAWHDLASGATETLTVERFAWLPRDGETMGVELTGSYGGRPADLQGIAGPLSRLAAGEAWPLDLRLQVGDATATAAGRVVGSLSAEDTDLTFSVSGVETGMVEGFFPGAAPVPGPYGFSGRLVGTAAGARFAELELSAGSVDTVRLQVSEGGGGLRSGEALDLPFTLRAASLAAFGERIGVGLPALGPLQATGRIAGSLDDLQVVDLDATVGEEAGLEIRGGRIEPLLDPEAIVLPLEARGPSLARFGDRLDLPLPPLGRYDLTGRLAGSASELNLVDLSGTLGGAEGPTIRIEGGRVEAVGGAGELALPVAADGASLAALGDMLGVALPDLGPYDLRGRVETVEGAVSLVGLTGAVGKEGVAVSIEDGRVVDLGDPQLIDLPIVAEGRSLAALGQALGVPLPSLGAYDLAARIVGTAAEFALADLAGTLGGESVQISVTGGRIESLSDPRDIQIPLRAEGGSLAALGQALGIELPDLGAYAFEARIAGRAESVDLAGLTGRVTGPQGFHLTIEAGRIEDLGASQGIDMPLQATGESLAALGETLGIALPELGAYHVQGRLTGAEGSVGLTGLEGRIGQGTIGRGTTGQGGGVTVTLSDGRIEDLQDPGRIVLPIAVEGTSLSRLGEALGAPLPDLGAYDLRARIEGAGGAVALVDLAGSIGGPEGPQIRIEDGRIEDLGNPEAISLSVSGDSFAALGRAFGLELPALGPFDLSGTVVAMEGQTRLQELSGTVGGSEGPTISLDGGSIENLESTPSVALPLGVSGPSLAALGEAFGAELPPLGAYDLDARLAGEPDRLRLEEIRGSVSPGGNTKIRLTGGSIGSLRESPTLELPFEAEGTDLARAAELAGQSLGVSGPFSASGTLSGRPGALALSDLQARWGRPEGAVVRLSGEIEQLAEPAGLDLELAAEAGDLENLGALFGVPLAGSAPARFQAHLSGGPATVEIENLNLAVGSATAVGSLEVAGLRDGLPRISGELEADRLDLQQVARWFEGDRRADGGETRLPLEALGLAEGSLDVRANRLAYGEVVLEAVRAAVVLEDGDLAIDGMTARVGGNEVEGALTAQVGPQARSADVALRFSGENLRLSDLVAGQQDRLKGALDVEVALDATGRTVEDLLADLEGEASVLGEDGELSGVPLERLVPDLDLFRLLPALGRGDDNLRLNCLIGEFDIEEGVAQTRALVDTRRMTLLGKGTIDLQDATLDLILDPRAKSRKLSRTALPVEIQGSLGDPEISPRSDAVGGALRGFLGGLLVPLNQLSALFGEDVRSACGDALRQVRARRGEAGRSRSEPGLPSAAAARDETARRP